MPRSTRRSAAAAAAAEEEEDAEPQSPTLALPAPVADIAGLKDDLAKFAFLQSVIQHGYMRDEEARDMYQQLMDTDSGVHIQSRVVWLNPVIGLQHQPNWTCSMFTSI